jgi:hypothetical protein
MTDYKQLCSELLNRLNGLYEEIIDAGVGYVPDEAQDLMNRAWEAMAQPEPEVYYEFVVSNDEGCTEAGGTAPTLSQAIDEGRHYLAQYSQDGHYTLEVHCVETVLIRRSN